MKADQITNNDDIHLANLLAVTFRRAANVPGACFILGSLNFSKYFPSLLILIFYLSTNPSRLLLLLLLTRLYFKLLSFSLKSSSNK
jgi:hypothetical protein